VAVLTRHGFGSDRLISPRAASPRRSPAISAAESLRSSSSSTIRPPSTIASAAARPRSVSAKDALPSFGSISRVM
jgi:hypothetical protein